MLRYFELQLAMVDRIYHYTDARGLLGILETRSLWCSHILFLNDSKEQTIGRHLYEETLREVIGTQRDRQLGPAVRAVAHAAIHRLQESEEPLDRPLLGGAFFVASFTSAHDNLTLWRAYAGPSARFCIGFDLKELDRLAGHQQYDLRPVDYDNGSVRERMLAEFCRRATRLWAEHERTNYHPRNPMAWHPPKLQELNLEVRRLASPFVKHESFRDEREWRLATKPFSGASDPSSRSGVQFRPSGSFLVPYRAFELCPSSNLIASITVGPTPNPEQAIEAVELLVMQASERMRMGGGDAIAANAKVEISKVPFRDWQ